MKKQDLGYEEPKHPKNSKAAIKEAKDKCGEILENLRSEIVGVPQLSNEVVYID